MVWLDGLMCTGSESDLFDCEHFDNVTTVCLDHSEDAGAICAGIHSIIYCRSTFQVHGFWASITHEAFKV